SVDDNYRCSKGLRSNSLTGSLAPRRRRPPRRPQHSLPCFMHPGVQRPWQLSRKRLVRSRYFRISLIGQLIALRTSRFWVRSVHFPWTIRGYKSRSPYEATKLTRPGGWPKLLIITTSGPRAIAAIVTSLMLRQLADLFVMPSSLLGLVWVRAF